MNDAIEKYVTHIKVSVLQEEIRTLRSELDTVKKERDEARREAEAEIANNENELNVVHDVNKSLRTALDKAERRVEHACVTLDHYGAHEAAERYREQTQRAQSERKSGESRKENEE